ncbi:UPF0158 family protein [Streptococcus suis]|uniref:UPF0158 family protein n=1 Tax=Streptococcus suis TaxID=1307 RepID=A0A9X4MN87_STRSU|nr:UPF0158 family protein [Streptococcus suis]MBY4982241.1 UPF0158 family protein [Streptococcus suis]MBY4992985.1 UPF0158 family protein [Streptococcus suis]MBY5008368.1 UPF0158 family protein [Streptococcus suis]MBY5025636.1 UPF0158 family protein [Streptococcus suis]MDG4516866.1 UPF0158 family protein [Streptococcus suis]
MAVWFQDVVDALQMLSQGDRYYYNSYLDELVYLSVEETGLESREGLEEEIEEDVTGRFVRLPTYYDFNPYAFMERYVYHLPEGDLSDRLSRAIRGRGAFRRFKNELERCDRLEEWYAFETQCYKELVLDWCQENEIAIVNNRLKKM